MLPPPPLSRHTGVVTTDRLEMISADPRVMHGQAVPGVRAAAAYGAALVREELLLLPPSR